MTAVAIKDRKASVRDASATATATERQIYWSVRNGRRCTFRVFDDDPIIGYVAGMDRYNYLVVCPTNAGRIRRLLVHKTVPSIELHEESSLEDEPQRDELVAAIAPFRSWIMREFFSQRQPRDAAS